MKKRLIVPISLLLLFSCNTNDSSLSSSDYVSSQDRTETKLRYKNIAISESSVLQGAVDIFIESLDSDANIYYLLLNYNSESPTEEELKEGTYDKSAVLSYGSGVNLIYTTVDSLPISTKIDCYCVLELNGSYSDIYKTDVITNDEESVQNKGDGTMDNPYKVYTIKDLENVALEKEDLSAYYELQNDIDLSEKYGEGKLSWTPIGMQSGSTKAFSGSFNGNGHTISNLYIDSKSESTGLFAQLSADGIITNLNLENVSIKTSMQRCGAVVGYCKGLVSNCNVVGGEIVSTANKVGGAIGEIYESGMASKIFTDLYVSGKGQNAGGILGSCDSPTSSKAPIEISQCYSKANVVGEKYVGGIIGYARCMNIESCYSMGTVTGVEGVGGLIGFSQHRKDSPVIPNINNSFVYKMLVSATSEDATNSSGSVIGNKSSSNSGVNVKNLYYLDVEVKASKINSNSFASEITLDKLSDEEWLKNTMEFDFRYAWELQEGALRPTLMISKDYDSGKEED